MTPDKIISYSVNTGLSVETKTIELSRELDVEIFTNFGFNKIADMSLTDTNNIGLKMMYQNYITSDKYREHSDGVYLIVINGKVVKIGGTSTGLSKRWASYGNGTAKIREAGNGSVTNYYVTTAIREALKSGCSVEWFYKKMDYETKTLNLYGTVINENVYTNGTYKMHEKSLLEFYKNQTNNYPKLSSNS